MKNVKRTIFIPIFILLIILSTVDAWLSFSKLSFRILNILHGWIIIGLVYYETCYKKIKNVGEVMFQFGWKMFLVMAIYFSLELLIS